MFTPTAHPDPVIKARERTPFDPSKPNAIEKLQVVFKVAERCNINCSYCYYFNMGETTALDRPAIVSLDTTRSLARWIAQGCQELRIPKVIIAFHGGEPMLLKPRRFDAICEIFRQEIGPVAELSFGMQTNGTILSDAWLSLFRKYEVRVGVSIDGRRDEHDRYRLDHRGRSTFDHTETTLRRLAAWANGNPKLTPATISVLDCQNDYGEIYRYLRGLGVEWMNFLLPDRNADNPIPNAEGAAAYGRALYEIFEAWFAEDNPDVHVKFIDTALKYFQLIGPVPDGDHSSVRFCDLTRRKKTYQVIIARSDGSVAIDDSYIPALSWYSDSPTYSVLEHSLREFLSDPIFREIDSAMSQLPVVCKACTWRQICRGGDLENRFSKRNGFDNPSVYCSGYKTFYRGMCELLVDNGYPRRAMEERIGQLGE